MNSLNTAKAPSIKLDSFSKKPVENRYVMFIVDRIFMHGTLSKNPRIIKKSMV
jgi:hypothetical protein